MSSPLHEDLTMQEMEASGEMDFIRSHVAAATGQEIPAPADEADTVEAESAEVEAPADEPEGTVEQPEGAADDEPEPEGDGQPDGQPEGEVDDDVLYIDLDEETQALLDSKYGGDLSKALAALREGQSLIGRQGNELGAVRQELEALRTQLTQGLAAAQPYPEWPDEFAEPSEAAASYREIAEAAFQRGDVQTFQRALGEWQQTDSVSAGLYSDLKEMQIAQAAAAQAAPVQADDTAVIEQGMQAIREKFPQFSDPAFQQAVSAELDKTPSLKAVLWEGVPGVSPQERLAILEEAAQRVASRTTSETAQAARKRVAIRHSEEARAARVAAQSVRGGQAREEAPEVEPRTVPLGETGRSLNIDRLNEMLSPEDRL